MPGGPGQPGRVEEVRVQRMNGRSRREADINNPGTRFGFCGRGDRRRKGVVGVESGLVAMHGVLLCRVPYR